MSSNAGQNPPSSKAVNIPNTASSTPFHSAAPADNSSQRRVGGPGSSRPGVPSKTSATPRNNQARKSQHNRQRKPQLLDDDEYNESAAMKSTTSRKGQTSITHLMNFSLPPRPQYQAPPRNIRRYTSWGAGAVDKSRYVHANYRFIVMPNQNFHAQAANADVHLDWASVLQVLVSAQTQAASCPICLSTPVAPRMARCGHIFCLPCLIRYMHSSDDDNTVPEKRHRWKKCPICWDSVYISETRPVRWFRGQEGDLPVEGGDVVLRLVKRESGSTLALPRDGSETLGPGEDVPWYHVADVADYARIMKGGEEYMTAQYDAEIEDLRRQEVEDELLFGDENTWTRKAIGSITDAKEKLKGIGNPPDVRPVKERTIPPTPASSLSTYSTVTSDISDETEHISKTLDGVHLDPESGAKAKEKGRSKQIPASSGPDQQYHFYQALPQFYLSPLDIRILKAAFGEYSLFPATILPRVEHISTGHIVDDELRKRVKYLGHLPQGCEVSFLECDWRDVVVPEVLGRFRAETDRRRRRNREKEAREEKIAFARRRKRTTNGGLPLGASGQALEVPASPLPLNANSTLFDTAASSASPPRSSSGFGALASPSTSPPGIRTVWGTTAVGSLSPSLDAQRDIHSDGWRQGWEDELFAQQESDLLAQTASGDQNLNPGSSSSGGKKKKKNKTKITLMATSSQRGA
ncbi:hypothetical protein N7472_008755 [Penicillium cf. griseofulvum]|uniref:RING-type domain-containing protein n=1 Tax=Penicillium cf. griseofulvum TaxID=2972120 RepID=A0A9W9J5T4_9EURO|nr:hypothetical protein N7472_008755 [Penicillium cf. griseofulvum]